jgi:hypothetical protein
MKNRAYFCSEDLRDEVKIQGKREIQVMQNPLRLTLLVCAFAWVHAKSA